METLETPVMYENEELTLKTHVLTLGYVNHVVVDLGGTQIPLKEMRRVSIKY